MCVLVASETAGDFEEGVTLVVADGAFPLSKP